MPLPTMGSFDLLLAWLNPNRERAGERYEEIRRRLIKIFAGHNCWEPEDLADETMRRVESNVGRVAPDWVNDPSLYFYAVARNVRHEYDRRKPPPHVPPNPGVEEAERDDVCLESCMEQMFTADERSLVLAYFRGQGREKIENRQRLCEQYGIGLNTLRIKIHRLLKRLRPCVLDCVARMES